MAAKIRPRASRSEHSDPVDNEERHLLHELHRYPWRVIILLALHRPTGAPSWPANSRYRVLLNNSRSCPKSETDMCYRCYKSRFDTLLMPGGWSYLYMLVVYNKTSVTYNDIIWSSGLTNGREATQEICPHCLELDFLYGQIYSRESASWTNSMRSQKLTFATTDQSSSQLIG